MENILTKKNVFLGSLSGAIIFFLVASTEGVPLFCVPHDIPCMKYFDSLATTIEIFIPLFFFSLITYKMPTVVFSAWSNFALTWISISILLIVISPSSSAPFQIIDKEFVAIVLSLLFTVISLILIAYKSFALRKKG